MEAIKTNRLTLLSKTKAGRAIFQCDCGNIKEIRILYVERNKTKSCGCYKKDTAPHYKDGSSKHPLYYTWKAMLNRCYNKENKFFKYYGAIGVKVCESWRNSFQEYSDWAIINGSKSGLQIDKDKIGDGLLYSPDTCCVVTRIENLNLRKSNVYINYRGELKTMKQLSELSGVKYGTIRSRILSGLSIDEIIVL